MAKTIVSERLDSIADHLQAIVPHLPKEAHASLNRIMYRLDRVSNSIDQSSRQGSTSRVAEVENELESSGLDFSVDPNIEGTSSTSFYVNKGQTDPRKESEILSTIAGKHNALLDSKGSQRVHKLTVSHN